MARKYDSSRREDAAQRTRETILDAAFKLHGFGIIDYESLAAEANVSLATVRKHFPTRELLYEGCTNWGMHVTVMPDLEQLALTPDPAERLRLALTQTHGLYEPLLGQLWTGYQHEFESPVLRGLLVQIDELLGEIVELILGAWDQVPGPEGEAKGFVRGLMSFLTYRALRHDGGLSPEQATERAAEALLHYFAGARGGLGRKEALNV